MYLKAVFFIISFLFDIFLDMSELNIYRKELEYLDFEFVDLIKKRQDLIKKIAEIKKANWFDVFQKDVYFRKMDKFVHKAKDLWLDTDFLSDFYGFLHRYSVEFQKEYLKKS